MGISTGIIRYNLNDRGRKHIGQERRFNVAKFAALVNGPKVQEMVGKGDMVGYLGHDVRRQFGLNPPETALQDGIFVPIEPAFVTTRIHVSPDGTVEHEARFLDTPLGKVVQQWHEAGTGGFSSVVAPDEVNPTDFYGFDYVRSPNFHGNRGYAVMDDASYQYELNRLTSRQKYQEIQARQMEQAAVMDALFQSSRALAAGGYDLARINRQLSATVESLAAQLEETKYRYAERQAAPDDLQPEFSPTVRLSVNEGKTGFRAVVRPL